MTGAYAANRRVREIRRVRGRSLRTVADLAGISPSYLSQLETGTRALDRHRLIVALADALAISPQYLTTPPVPAPGNGALDSAIEAVRQALLAAGHHRAGGQVLPVEVLRARVTAMVDAHGRCDPPGALGAALPALIRDVHTSIGAGLDMAQLLDLWRARSRCRDRCWRRRILARRTWTRRCSRPWNSPCAPARATRTA